MKSPYKRWLFRLFFGVVAYFVLLQIFVGQHEAEMVDYVYTAIFLTTLVVAGAINSWGIRKRFLAEGRFFLFVILSLGNIALWTFFNQLLFDKLIDYFLPGYYFISYYSYLDLFQFFLIYVVVITLLDLSWEWFQLQETRNKVLLMEKQKIDAELKALMNQVNPHFLFNSLTALYALSLKSSPDTSAAILKLADILRYVIYESANGEVPLRSEISMIQSYIDLQRYRAPAHSSLRFTAEVDRDDLPIKPMILLPLVENSFKHGLQSDITDPFVHIHIQMRQGTLEINIKNDSRRDAVPSETPGGVGLKNVRERLMLMYPHRHELYLSGKAHEFDVSLKLKLI